MAKVKNRILFRCRECGGSTLQWAGQCPECGSWNSLEESVEAPPVAPDGRRAGYAGAAADLRSLPEVSRSAGERTQTGLAEVDRVLGGGLVAGSVVLIGGDPGIGKSTLLLQVLAALRDRLSAIYVAGEESLQQISLRADRLGLPDIPLMLLAETSVERVLEVAARQRPQVMVIDSVQTMRTEALHSAPGAVAQVRESTARLVRYAKQTGTSVLLVGHVTKEGNIAGPRVLEHMVDTVLYFENDATSRFRIVRAAKNRFGAVNELGVFAMTDTGLREVSNPSAIFLSRHDAQVSGSVITCVREGSRPLLLELQALVDESHLSNPRRVTLGLDSNRLAMLLAVLHRHGGIATFGQDVFVNAVGGMRVGETAADLPVLLAVLSSLRDRPVPRDTVAFGEVGLAGEIRPVPGGEERLREAAKQGFSRAVVPRANAPRAGRVRGLEVVAVQNLAEALDSF
ncbi:MAG TPA: DNA repair protein RadA [Gammaproteobacteria bacterium]|nr:DNA repair protein RadA [Gammaproteobacteria bacterium]